MLAAAGKGNRIVTLDIPGARWDTPQLAGNWNAGSRTDATSACLSAARKVFRLPVKQPQNRAGLSPR